MLFRRIIILALVCGFLAGTVFSVFQFLFITPVILQAEELESGMKMQTLSWGRIRNTLASNFLFATGLCLLLTGCLALWSRNKPTSALSITAGLYWGMALWFIVFAMPMLSGLMPQLPGMSSINVEGRQLQWSIAAVSGLIGVIIIMQSRTAIKLIGPLIPVCYLIWAWAHHQDHTAINTPSNAAQYAELQQNFIPLTAIGTLLLTLSCGLSCAFFFTHWIKFSDKNAVS